MLKPIRKIIFFIARNLPLKVLLIAALLLFSEVNAQEQNNKKLPNLFGSSAVPNDSTVHKNYVAIKDLFDVVSSLFGKHPIEDNVDSLSTKPILTASPC